MLIAQGTQTGGAQEKELAARRFQTYPPRSQNPQEMTAGKNQNIAWQRANLLNNAVRPLANLPGDSPSGQPVAKEMPSGPFRVDLGKTASFVITAIPFDEIRLNPGDLSKTSQLTGSDHPLERAGEDRRQREAL